MSPHWIKIFILTSLILCLAVRAPAADEWFIGTREGNVETLSRLLGAGVDVNSRDRYGLTAINLAATAGKIEAVKFLLESGADPNIPDSFYGMSTPISQAASHGHIEIVSLLLDKGAKPSVNVLRSVADAGNVEVVKLIIKKGGLSEAILKTALKTAINKGQTEVVKAYEASGITLLDASPSTPAPSPTPEAGPEREAALERMKNKIVEDTISKIDKPANWASFRGPGASGVADGQHPPTAWDAPKGVNIRWSTSVPGLGHSSPVVWGGKVFITTAVSGKTDEYFRHGLYGDVDSVDDNTVHSWHVYCIDKKLGSIVWDKVAREGVPQFKRHMKSTLANSTPATDGKHVVAFFGAEGLYCYGMDGSLLWKKDLGKLDSGWFFDPTYQWGFASSPIIYKDMVIVQCDVQKDSFIAAFKIEDGSPVWKTERDEIPSWGTPTVIDAGDHAELVANATRLIRGYDPMTGKELWKLAGNSEVTAPTPVFARGLILVTSGYRPIQPVYAIRPGAKGDISLEKGKEKNDSIAWSTQKGGPYMPTPLVYGEYLYTCSNQGILACVEAETGKSVYKSRLGHMGGGYSGSPVAADGRIYLPSEDGEIFVVKAGPEYELLATNPMGEVLMTTPAISDGMIFIRTLHHLFGVGRTEQSVAATK